MKLFGTEPSRKIRYAIVGLGWISQESLMPGVAHTGNSVMTAFVTGDAEKARVLGEAYGVAHAFDYASYPKLLQSGEIDAVYLALPNSMHRDFAVPALEAGLHLLLEKPMAPSEAECREIIDAAARNHVKLMLAYRLHFEEGTVAALEVVQSGEIGEPKLFDAVFSQQVAPGNHRTKSELWAGPIPDMGPYPINAARQLFRAEPTEVMAWSARSGEARFAEIEETVSVILRFPDEKLATFTLCYGGASVNAYRVVGSKGDIAVEPGFTWGKPLRHRVTVDGKTREKSFPPTDQFGGELKYFSDCILNDTHPEPDGEEGLADVRVCLAIEEALRTGLPQRIEPLTRKARPIRDQVQSLRFVPSPTLVNAKRPGEE